MKSILKYQIELNRLHDCLGEKIIHMGIFGSVARGTNIDLAHDLDVLVVYDGISFEEILAIMDGFKSSVPFFCSYLNYSSITPLKNEDEFYIDFLFMPKNKPNRKFMRKHEGKIYYLTSEFDSWKIPNVNMPESMAG